MSITEGKFHATMTAVQVSAEDGMVRGFSGGAPPALWIGTAGAMEAVVVRGAPLGAKGELIIGTFERTLAKGERLLLVTDGVTEMPTSAGRQFGLRQLQKLMRSTMSLELTACREAMANGLRVARGNQSATDDITFALIERG